MKPGDERELALEGIDPTSYVEGAPQQGDERWSHRWRGRVWRFGSESNLRRFQQSPERYAPAYDGYCELAMSFGKLAQANPRAFRLEGDRVYLGGSPAVSKVASWVPGLRRRADAAWRRLQEQASRQTP